MYFRPYDPTCMSSYYSKIQEWRCTNIHKQKVITYCMAAHSRIIRNEGKTTIWHHLTSHDITAYSALSHDLSEPRATISGAPVRGDTIRILCLGKRGEKLVCVREREVADRLTLTVHDLSTWHNQVTVVMSNDVIHIRPFMFSIYIYVQWHGYTDKSLSRDLG